MAYARVFSLMGLTWIFSFLVIAFNKEWLWVTHILLNGSQGVYLMVCFVLKKRVWVMLKERLKGKKVTGRATCDVNTTTNASST